MARLLLRLPTRASHYNMVIKPMESGAGKLRGIMTTCFVVNDGLAAKDSRSGGGVQQSMMAVDFPRSLADTI